MTQTYNNEADSFDAIKGAHHLSGDASKLKDYYEEWADAYDKDVSNEAYAGPRAISEFYDRVRQEYTTISREDSKVMDAGCGTGLVGVILKDMGYRAIDGFDLSEKMVEVAKDTNSYQELLGGIDMNYKIEAYQDNQYDASLACGVFTLGHVPPESINEMIRFTRTDGLIIVSTRKSYYNGTNFQEVVDQLQTDGKVKLLEHWKDGPYITEEGAHYWALQVC
ncbi:UNVERIFIED_CONTAM: ubiquinone/menaquinone biosynthesis protein [Euhalothece sp. KZN 001]